LCPRCGETKPVDQFYLIAGGARRAGYCVPCTKAEAIEWQKANPEKKAVADRKEQAKPGRRAKKSVRERLRREANPEREAARVAAWQAANPEKVRARQKRFHERNPEARREYQARYHATDRYKQIHADRERLRRAILKQERYEGGIIQSATSIEGKFTLVEWERLKDAFDNRCAYCGGETRLTIEHLTPLSRGGKNEVGNIAPACQPCNTSKNARTAEEFIPERAAEIRERALLH